MKMPPLSTGTESGDAFIRSVARAARQHAETLLREWLPGGTVAGDEYNVINPLRDDRHTGNFKVNLVSCKWSDFALDGPKSKGGDLVSLYAYIEGTGQLKAAREIAKRIGHPPQGKPSSQPSKPRKPSEPSQSQKADPFAGWRLLPFVPDGSPAPYEKHRDLGTPSRTWAYQNPDGFVSFYVYRFDLPDDKEPDGKKKETRPLTLWASPDGSRARWRWKGPDEPRLIYHLNQLYDRPDAPVLVVEGEKAACAAADLLPGFISTTSPFGSKSPDRADWTVLKGREVTIWPDRDKPGEQYAISVARLARAAGAASVRIVDWRDTPAERMSTLEDGMDIADLEKNGWSVEQIAGMVENAKPYRTRPSTPARTRPESPQQGREAGGESPQQGREAGGESEGDESLLERFHATAADPADLQIVAEGIDQCNENPGILFSEPFIEAWRNIRAVDPEADACIRVEVKRAKPNGVLLKDVDGAVRAGESAEAAGGGQADALVELALEQAEFFHDAARETFAALKGRRETYRLDTVAFHEWLSYSYYQKTKDSSPGGRGSSLSDSVIKSAVTTLKGVAKHDGPEQPCFLRAAQWQDGCVIDLGDDAWRAVIVTPAGWHITDDSPVRFWRPDKARPLPTPVPGGDLSALWGFVNIPEAERPLVIAWMLDAFRPETPFPVLQLSGGQGSLKSSTQKRLRQLIDPNAIDLRSLSEKTEDVFVGAINSWLVSLNNLSNLTGPQQDALCCLATGGGYAGRTLYTNVGETAFEVKRPVIVNGITPTITAQDLTDRVVHIDLPRFTGYRSESCLDREFEAIAPGLFGGLLDLLVSTLARLPEVTLDDPPRMVDFTLLGEAMMQAAGEEPGTFDQLFKENRQASALRGLEASPVVVALCEMADNATDEFVFKGTVGQLLDQLDPLEKHRHDRAWPRSARGLTDILRRQIPAMRQSGIYIEFEGHTRNGTVLTITQDPDPDLSSPQPTPTGPNLSEDGQKLWDELRTANGYRPNFSLAQSLHWSIDQVDAAAGELAQCGLVTIAGTLIGRKPDPKTEGTTL